MSKKLHVGCGTNYIKDWINIDLDSPLADLKADLREPLPYKNDSVDFIFNEHFIEHITRSEGVLFLKECRRVLKNKSGVLRISTPDLRWLVAQYISGNLKEWENVYWVPKSPCELLNEGMRLWGHQYVYDQEDLIQVLKEAGFSKITLVKYHESLYTDLKGLECRPWHRELIIEAQP